MIIETTLQIYAKGNDNNNRYRGIVGHCITAELSIWSSLRGFGFHVKGQGHIHHFHSEADWSKREIFFHQGRTVKDGYKYSIWDIICYIQNSFISFSNDRCHGRQQEVL